MKLRKGVCTPPSPRPPSLPHLFTRTHAASHRFRVSSCVHPCAQCLCLCVIAGAADRRAAWMADMYSRSDKFDTYYAAQHIVPAEEYEELIATLLKPLPVTFRVNPLDASAPAILHKLRTEYAEPIALSEGAVLEQPRNLPWYPRGLAWHVSLGRGDLRKHATLKELHAWLVMLNANGSITRQVCDDASLRMLAVPTCLRHRTPVAYTLHVPPCCCPCSPRVHCAGGCEHGAAAAVAS